MAVWDELTRPSLLTLTVLDVISVKPHMLPAWDLWRYAGFLKKNGQEAATYEVAFWGKVVTPLVTLVMLFLSIPFVFGPLTQCGHRPAHLYRRPDRHDLLPVEPGLLLSGAGLRDQSVVRRVVSHHAVSFHRYLVFPAHPLSAAR